MRTDRHGEMNGRTDRETDRETDLTEPTVVFAIL
jgi:hypothetical protein